MFQGILIVVLICVIFLAAFAVQNTGPVTIRFFSFTIGGAPIYSVVVVSAALGAIITALVAVWWRVRVGLLGRAVQRKIREHEKAVGDLTGKVEALQAERDQLARNMEQLSSEREGLRSRIGELESKLGVGEAETRPVEDEVQEVSRTAEPEGEPAKPAVEEALKEQPRGWLPWR